MDSEPPHSPGGGSEKEGAKEIQNQNFTTPLCSLQRRQREEREAGHFAAAANLKCGMWNGQLESGTNSKTKLIAILIDITDLSSTLSEVRFWIITTGFPRNTINSSKLSAVYKGQREIGVFIALNFLGKISSPVSVNFRN